MTQQQPEDIQRQESFKLFVSPPHECGYLPDIIGTTLFVNPNTQMETTRYEHLLANGFRRSGNTVYRPWCRECSACIPIRLPVRQFQPSRSFRRIIKRNQDLTVHIEKPEANAERFNLAG